MTAVVGEWASIGAHSDAVTAALDDLIDRTPDLPEEERPAAMDYNARLVTRLRETGLWP